MIYITIETQEGPHIEVTQGDNLTVGGLYKLMESFPDCTGVSFVYETANEEGL